MNFKELCKEKLNLNSKNTNNNFELELNENNTFQYVNPECPICESTEINKKGIHTKEKQNKHGKTTYFSLQKYKCKKCGRKFTTKVQNLIKINKHFLNEFKELIPEIMKNGYQSLRKISKYFKIFLGIKISHQAIKNWIKINVKNQINNENHNYSGYYTYYEQFLRINGHRIYCLTLYDTKLNILTSEKIVTKRTLKPIKEFIAQILKNKPIKSITTDLFPMCLNIMDELKIKYQLCLFHLNKTINHKIKTYICRKKVTKLESDQIYKNAKELKEIFKQKNSKEAINLFKQYLTKYNNIQEVLRQFIHKHIINHLKRYIEHLDNHNINKTSNEIENYYRQPDPEKIKKKYKTKKGILTFLHYQMKNWTEKHGKNI